MIIFIIEECWEMAIDMYLEKLQVFQENTKFSLFLLERASGEIIFEQEYVPISNTSRQAVRSYYRDLQLEPQMTLFRTHDSYFATMQITLAGAAYTLILGDQTAKDQEPLACGLQLLHYLLLNEKFDANIETTTLSRLEIFSEFQSNRVDKIEHYNFDAEEYIFKAIKDGNEEKVAEYFHAIQWPKIAHMFTKTLRQKKIVMHAIIALSSRAALEGGVSKGQIYTMSNAMYKYVEELHVMQDPKTLMVKFYAAFATAVREYNKNNLSELVYAIQLHIILYIYEPLPLPSLAEHFHMNASYLSQKFKQETGKGIHTFVNECKIEEAKLLLYHKQYDYAKIASLLGFTDQSHFIKVFKKHTGVLPSAFKKYGYNN